MEDNSSIDTIIEEDEELSFSNVLVITNLPTGVPPEKQAKLQTFLSKVITSDPSTDILHVHIPLNPADSTTLGVAIVTLSDESKMGPVMDRVDGFEVSRGQQLKAFRFEAVESILEDAMSRQEEQRDSEAIQIINRTTQRNWLMEEPRMEQIMTRFDDETEISWIDPLEPAPKLYYGGDREKVNGKKWCDLNVEYSPNGSYLLTSHGPGVALWSGKHFAIKTRFEHSHVAGALFSPDEQYLLTYRHPISPDDREVVKVWRVLNGELLRSFSNTAGVLTTDQNESGFLWSPSSKYLSRVVHGQVFVYEAPSMKLLVDSRTRQPAALRYQNVKVMSWSPAEDWLALWSPEGSNEPASLVVVDVDNNRTEITAKKIFSTGDSPAELFWHPEGDCIALKASRLLTRSKKTGKAVFEIIRLREKGVPSESLEGFGTSIVSLAWEPTSNGRMAVVVGEDRKVTPSATNPTGIVTDYKLKFYSVVAGQPIEEPSQDHTIALQNASYNTVVWSPYGQYLVLVQGPTPCKKGCKEISGFAPSKKLAATGNPNGEIMFYSCTASGLELLRKDEHVNCNMIEWDPSGRFLITAVTLNVAEKTSPSYKLEQYSGYALWTFQGRSLKRVEGVRLWNVGFRPHVRGLLTVKEKKAALKQLREKAPVFDEQDKAVKNAKKEVFLSGFRSKQRAFDEEMAAIDAHFAEAFAQEQLGKWARLYNAPQAA
jgi:translation initiation factor 3 subunit B